MKHFLILIFFTLMLITCQKNQQNVKQEPLPKYLTVQEFVGNPEEFEAYRQALFIPREEFLGNNEDFITYVKVVNDQRMQKGYFTKKRQEEELAKQPKIISASKVSTRLWGSYPQGKGQILATDEPNVSGTGIYAGHAAIIYSKDETIESFLWSTDGKPSGVQKHRNNWKDRYLNWNVYGVESNRTSYAQDAAAADWAFQQIGKSYNGNVYYYEHDGSFYCSQLVYRAYKNKGNVDISNGASYGWVSPMDLINSVNTSYVYIR